MLILIYLRASGFTNVCNDRAAYDEGYKNPNAKQSENRTPFTKMSKTISSTKGLKQKSVERKRQTKSMVALSSLKKAGKHYEFGVEINFANERDCRNYIVYVSEWLAEITLPGTVEGMRDFVKRHKKPHRLIVWRLLAHNGNKRARCLFKAYDKSLKQEDIDHMDEEVQGNWFETLITLLGWLLAVGWRIVKDRNEKFMNYLKSLNLPEKSKKAAGDLFRVLSSTTKTVVEAGKAACHWMKQTFQDLLSYFPSLSSFMKGFLKGFFFIMLIVAAGKILAITLPAIAIMTVGWLFVRFGFRGQERVAPVIKEEEKEEEVQGYEEPTNYTELVFGLITDNFSVPADYLRKGIGKLPRLHSIGKAIEFFTRYAVKIATMAIEWWTGKPIASTEVETSIVQFIEEVELFQLAVRSADISLSLADKTIAKDEELKQMKIAIEKAMGFVASRAPLRPYFSSKMAHASNLYATLHMELEHIRRSAKKRPVPVWIYISGTQGVGKSHMVEQLMRDIWNALMERCPGVILPREWTYRDMFIMNQGELFFDGYSKQFFVLIDDFMQAKDPEIRRNTALNLINMIAGVPYSLKVATPEQKAATFFESRCIISTTNLKSQVFDADSIGLEDPKALSTRRTVSVKMVKEDVFELYDECIVKVDGVQVKTINYAQLLELSVQALIARHEELAKPYTQIKSEPLNISLSTQRLKFDIQLEEEVQGQIYSALKGPSRIDAIMAVLPDVNRLNNEVNQMYDQIHAEDIPEDFDFDPPSDVVEHSSSSEWDNEGYEIAMQGWEQEYASMMQNMVVRSVGDDVVWSDDGPTRDDWEEMHYETHRYWDGWDYDFEHCVDDDIFEEKDYTFMVQDLFPDEDQVQMKRTEDQPISDKKKEEKGKEKEDEYARIDKRVPKATPIPHAKCWSSLRFLHTTPVVCQGLHREEVEEIIRVGTLKPREHIVSEHLVSWEYKLPESEPLGGEIIAVHPFYVGNGCIVLVFTPEDWAWLQFMYKSPETHMGMKTDKGTCYSLYPESKNQVPGMMGWLPNSILVKMMDTCPEYVIPHRTIESFQHGDDWKSVRKNWFDNLGTTDAQRRKYQDLLTSWRNYPDTEEDFNKFYAKVHRDTHLLVYITGSLVALGIFAAIAYKLCRNFLPGPAYREVQSSYGGLNLGRRNPQIIRSRGKNGNGKRTNMQRDSHARDQAQMMEREWCNEYKVIDRNTEIVQVKDLTINPSNKEIEETPVQQGVYGIWMGGQWMLCPGHVFTYQPPEVGLERWVHLGRHTNYHVKMEDLEIVPVRGDVVAVKFPDVQMKQNIHQLFATSEPTHGTIDRVKSYVDAHTFSVRSSDVYEMKEKHLKLSNHPDVMTDLVVHHMPNSKGYCGLPYCMNASGQIIGVHMGGNPKKSHSYVTLIFKQDIERFKPEYKTLVDPVSFNIKPNEEQVQCGIQMLGLSDAKHGSYVPNKTKLARSKFAMEGFPFPKTDSRPASLRAEAALKAFEKLRKQYYPRKPYVVNTDLSEFVTSFSRKNIRMLTVWEAIHGIPGFIPSLDRTTSVGYFYKKLGLTRRQLFFDKDGNPWVHPLLEKSVLAKLERIRRGEIVIPVYEDTLKDELRDAERVKNHKTRLFTSGDLDWLIIQRMVLGTLVAESEGDPTTSPCGLGLNPHSKEWGALYSELVQMLAWLAGDFGGYDISVKIKVIEVYIEFMKWLAGDKINHYLVEWVVRATFMGWHVFGTVWYLRPWGTNSGSYITSHFNTFANWWLHKQAFLKLYPDGDFRECAKTFTGDDSLLGTPAQYPLYTMDYLALYFEEQWGMEYTSCFKGEIRSFALRELQYLKRTFVEGDIGIMAPLDPRSMYDMVAWETAGAGKEIYQSVLDSLLLEGFHYGKEIYNKLRSWAQYQQCLGGNWKLLTYEEMVRMRRPDYAL